MSIRFCEDCGNMLTPTENEKTHRLKYLCSMCKNPGEEKDNINNMSNSQTIKINSSIINDPTYARTLDLECPRCGYKEAICFQNPNINDAGMKFMYVCCNRNYDDSGEPCGKQWFKEGENDNKK